MYLQLSWGASAFKLKQSENVLLMQKRAVWRQIIRSFILLICFTNKSFSDTFLNVDLKREISKQHCGFAVPTYCRSWIQFNLWPLWTCLWKEFYSYSILKLCRILNFLSYLNLCNLRTLLAWSCILDSLLVCCMWRTVPLPQLGPGMRRCWNETEVKSGRWCRVMKV